MSAFRTNAQTKIVTLERSMGEGVVVSVGVCPDSTILIMDEFYSNLHAGAILAARSFYPKQSTQPVNGTDAEGYLIYPVD